MEENRNANNKEDKILRPDIHSQLNELLHENAPTTLFVDNLLNNAYVSPAQQEEENKLGPLSMLYNKPYSISPNNIYQSIVITQLSDRIKSKDDIDVQVIYPNELHLIATGQSLSNCTQINDSLNSKTRSKSTSSVTNRTTTTTTTTVTKIELEPDLIITQTVNQDNDVKSTECQTDIHLDPLENNSFTRTVCTPSMAETESISFYYIDETERMRQLDSMLSDDYYLQNTNNTDPCLEFESYLRGRTSTGSNSNPVNTSQSRSRSSSTPVKYESSGTQTFLSVLAPATDEHRSTQTSPELLRRYINSISSTPPDSPQQDNIRAKTVAFIRTLNDEDDQNNKIKETFTIRNRSKSGDGVQYAQISEYKTDLVPRNELKISDLPVIKIHESIILTQDDDDVFDFKANKKTAKPNIYVETKANKSKDSADDETDIKLELKPNKSNDAIESTVVDLKPNKSNDAIDSRAESVDAQNRRKLAHSTIEITQVTDNATTVTGLCLGGNATDRFSMSVNMPSTTPVQEKKTEPKVEEKPIKIIDVIVPPKLKQEEEEIVPQQEPAVKKIPPTLPKTMPEKSNKIIDLIVQPKLKPEEAVIVPQQKIPPPLPKTMPSSKPPVPFKYTEDTYDVKFSSKRKPIIIECNDPQMVELEKKIDDVQLPSSVAQQLPQIPTLVNTIHKQLVKPPPVVNRLDSIKSRLNAGGFQQPQQSQIKPAISRRSILTSSSSSLVSMDDTNKSKSFDHSARKASILTLSESSKISFNAQDPEIIDIDFDVYDQNVIERHVQEVDDEPELNTAASTNNLTDLNNNNIEIDFSVYDEEPRMIRSLTPTVYSEPQQQFKRPPVPVKARLQQTSTKLSNSSVNLNQNFANQQETNSLAPRKLFSDWQNLIENVEPQNAPFKKNLLNNNNNNFQSNLSLNFEQQKQTEKLEYTVGRGPALSVTSTVSGLDTGVEADIDEEFIRMNKRNKPRLVENLMPPTNQFNQRLPQPELRRDGPSVQQPANQVSLVPVSTQIVVDTEHNITSDLNLIRNLRSKFKTQQIVIQQQQQSEASPNTEKISINNQQTVTTTTIEQQNSINKKTVLSTKLKSTQKNSILQNSLIDNTNSQVAAPQTSRELDNQQNSSLKQDETKTKTIKSEFKQSNNSLDSLTNINTNKLSKMHKIMTTTAEKEYQKLLRRIERRRVRVPEILEQLKTVKSVKERRKLEEELRLLMRKSERDNLLLNRYITQSQTPPLSPRETKSDNEEDNETRTLKTKSNLMKSDTNLESSSMTSFSTTHSKLNSCNSLIDNDEGKKKHRTRAMARESGYSSCGDESGNEHVCKLNKHRNESIESNLEEIPQVSAMKSAIKSNVVDKILIDSSNFIVPKSKNLRIIYNKSPQLTQQQTEYLTNDEQIYNRQSSKLEDLMIELPQIDIAIPSEISVNSSGSERRLSTRTDVHYDVDSPNDRFNPNRRQRNLFPGSQSSYSGRNVPLSSAGSSGSGSYRVVPSGNTAASGNSGSYNANQSTPRQQVPTSTSSASSINISPIGGNIQSNASSSLIRQPSTNNINNEPQQPNINDFQIEYISESSLGDMSSYQVERDPKTGQYYIINYLKKIKYIIVPDAIEPDLNNNNNETIDTNEQNRIVEYVEEADLSETDLTNADTMVDPVTGENIIFNRNNPIQQWIILPPDWRESEDSPYFASDDIDTSTLDVYTDPTTRRKFITDEKTGNRYYLIDSVGMSRDFREKWAYFSHLNQPIQVEPTQPEPQRLSSIRSNETTSNPAFTSGQTTPNSDSLKVSENNDEDAIYVDEKTLEEIDLSNAHLVEEAGDVYLYHTVDPSTRWIVLPSDWQVNENSNFVDKQDLDMLEWDVYVDNVTKRRYVIDEKTGQKFFIVKNENDAFKKKWTKLVNLQSKLNPIVKPQPSKRISFNPDISDNNNSGLVEKFQTEPSNFKLRSSLKNSPERDNNLNLKKLTSGLKAPENQTKLIIKQPGKPGHLINTQKQSNAKAKSKSPLNKDIKRTMQQQNALRAQQEASRRAFLNQKMPSVGKLWIHQLLIDNQRKEGEIRARISQSTDNRSDEDEEMARNRKHWKSLTHLDDPTIDSDSALLDRNRLIDIQINGYNKYDKKIQAREKIDYNEDTYNAYWKDLHTSANCASNNGFGGGDNTFVRGILTEDFKRTHQYSVQQLNSRYRAVVPREKLQLKHQFLLTPRYLKDSWDDTLSKSYKMKPRIILINDNERILTAQRNCNVYVQFDYDNDSVMGVNPMYQFMLPDCGPVHPTRPLLITPGKIDRLSKKLAPQGRPVDLALRDAPVFVYHQDGSAFYENIAQYLAGRYPQLSPKTARKILQFADMKEFEDYLASKITREEAKRISELSGSDLINIDTVRNSLFKTSGVDSNVNNKENSVFFHKNCEYDPLRNIDNEGNVIEPSEENRPNKSNDTHEIQINGQNIKSTFIGFKPTGQVEQLKYEDLPVDVRRALQQMPKLEQKFFADSNRKRLIPKI